MGIVCWAGSFCQAFSNCDCLRPSGVFGLLLNRQQGDFHSGPIMIWRRLLMTTAARFITANLYENQYLFNEIKLRHPCSQLAVLIVWELVTTGSTPRKPILKVVIEDKCRSSELSSCNMVDYGYASMLFMISLPFMTVVYRQPCHPFHLKALLHPNQNRPLAI